MLFSAVATSCHFDIRCLIQSRTLGGFYQLRVSQLVGGYVTIQLGSTRPVGLGQASAQYMQPFREALVALTGMNHHDVFVVDFAWTTDPIDSSRPRIQLIGSAGRTVEDLSGLVLETVDFADFPAEVAGSVPPFDPTWEQKWSIQPGTLYALKSRPITEQTLFYINEEQQLCIGYKVTVAGALIVAEEWSPPVLTPSLIHYDDWAIEPPTRHGDRRALTSFR